MPHYLRLSILALAVPLSSSAAAQSLLEVGDEIELGEATTQDVYDVACNDEVCAVVQDPVGLPGPMRMTILSTDGSILVPQKAIVPTEESWNVSHPQVAVGTTSILVVWQSGVPGGDELHSRVFATDGSPLGDERILSDGNGNGDGDVAFDGTNYRLVWGWFDGYMSFEMRALRLAEDGAPLGPYLKVATPNRNQSEMDPSIACRGGDCVVVWQDYNIDYAWPIGALRLGPDGARVGEPWTLLPEPQGGYFYQVAATTDGYAVGWTEPIDSIHRNLRAGSLGRSAESTLSPEGGSVFAENIGRHEPSLAANVLGVLRTWSEDLGDPGFALRGSLVAPGGDRTEMEISRDGADDIVISLRVVRSGPANFWAVYVRMEDSGDEDPPARLYARHLRGPDDVEEPDGTDDRDGDDRSDGGDEDSSGGCSTGGRNAPGWSVAVLVLVLGARRRRRPHDVPRAPTGAGLSR